MSSPPPQLASGLGASSSSEDSLGAAAAGAGAQPGALSVASGMLSSPSKEGIMFVKFNQDNTSLTVATTTGFRLYSIGSSSLDLVEPIYTWPADCPQNAKSNTPIASEPVLIVERLFSSSLLALVTKREPRRLKVNHFKKGTEICNFSYTNTVLAVRMNRARLVVCLEDSLFIHNIRDMKILHTIKETPPNYRGICALSTNADLCYLAYPGSNTRGDVAVFDALNLQSKHMISAHNGIIAALTFSPSGKLLATASESGTIIRICDMDTGTVLTEHRRSMMRCARVFCLSFSPDNKLLALSSNTETIHVFKALDPNRQGLESSPEGASSLAKAQAQHSPPSDAQAGVSSLSSWTDMGSAILQSATPYLPSYVTDTLAPTRSFATVYMSSQSGVGPQFTPEEECTVALANIGRITRLLLASKDGYLYIYNLPGNDSHECSLVKQHRLDTDCTVCTFPNKVKSPEASDKPDLDVAGSPNID